MWTQGTLNATPEHFMLHFHVLRLTTAPIWWWISLVSCLIASCSWDKLLFALTSTQYTGGACLLKALLQCINWSMTQNTPLFSSTLKASLTQHSDFTVIAALSKAFWGHYVRLPSVQTCSTSQLANSAALLQQWEHLWFLCKTTKIKRPLP